MKRNYLKMIAGPLIAAAISGCGYYKYTVDVSNPVYHPVDKQEWQSLDQENILVVHYEGKLLEINNILFNSTMDSITFSSAPFSGLALAYYNQVYVDLNRKTTRALGHENKVATRQVHLFLNKLDTVESSNLKFAVSDISRVDVVGKAANIPLIVASVVGGPIVVAYAVLLIACACPHVYVDQGNGLELANSLFTGANASQMERYDFKQLPDYYNDSTKFAVTIVNELNENQYTNLLELVVALHPNHVEVIADKLGHLHTIENPKAPVIAIDNGGQSILNELTLPDDLAYAFNSDSISELSEVYLTFPRTEGQTNGKLVLRLRNSPWAGYVYNEFNSLFGKNYSNWIEMIQDRSKEERELWMKDQGMLLLIDVKTEQGWQNIDQVDFVGEISYNSIVVPLTLVSSAGPLEIRLRSAFMFWELDYTAIDYSSNQEIQVQVLQPSTGTGMNGEDFRQALSFDDDIYMELLVNNTSTTVTFDSLITDPGLSRTLILCGKGYYVSNKAYTGKTYRKELQKFRNPGELSRFSRKLYVEMKTRTAQN